MSRVVSMGARFTPSKRLKSIAPVSKLWIGCPTGAAQGRTGLPARLPAKRLPCVERVLRKQNAYRGNWILKWVLIHDWLTHGQDGAGLIACQTMDYSFGKMSS
jgi:hypothetical protein